MGVLLLCACGANTAKKNYVLAEKLWTDKKYAAAVTEFDKVYQKDPHGKLGLQALYRSATTESIFLSEYSEAIKRFRLFVDRRGDDADGLASLWDAEKQIGELLYSKTEQYDQAIVLYEKLIKQAPTSDEVPEFQFRIAKSHFFLRQFDQAVQKYQEIESKFPQSPLAEDAAYEIGLTQFTRGEQHPGGAGPGMGSYQTAIESYQRFIKKYPASPRTPEARFGIASCLEELDQIDAAYLIYQSLLSTYPAPKVIQIKLVRLRERKAQRSR
jgi:TolA-binding protein